MLSTMFIPEDTPVRKLDTGEIVTAIATPRQYDTGVFAVAIRWADGFVGVTTAENLSWLED